MKGFTLIELLIVIMIISIMGAVVIPACLDLKTAIHQQEQSQTIVLD